MAARRKDIDTAKKSKRVAAKRTTNVVRQVKTKKTQAGEISVPYFASSGEKKGNVSLPNEIFGQKPNKQLLAQAVRVYLSNQRSAKAKTKGRGEVSRTTKKVYRQKGTGGARHGARSAPIYVGGGIAHGPRGIENYELSLPRSMRKRALISALSAKAQMGAVAVVDLDKIGTKTGKLAKIIKQIGMSGPVVVYHANKDLYRAARNIDEASFVTTSEVNTYQVMAGQSLTLTKDAIADLNVRFAEKEKK